jgi:hypothetical protein
MSIKTKLCLIALANDHAFMIVMLRCRKYIGGCGPRFTEEKLEMGTRVVDRRQHGNFPSRQFTHQ